MAEEFEGPRVQDINTTGLDVLYKVDFNVPLKELKDKKGAFVVEDDSRITAVQDTVGYFKAHQPKRVLFLSHLGKPKGKVVPEMSLRHVVEKASEILGIHIEFVEDYRKGIPKSGWAFLENVRFDPREESKDQREREEYAKELCDLVDENGIVVFDAFGAGHRKHATAYEIMKYRRAYAGFLMQKEIQKLTPFINPGDGSLAILAGAKIEDKIEHVEGFLQKYDTVLLGGGMIFTFYKARALEIGESIINLDMIEKCRELLERYGTEKGNGRLLLPVDIVTTKILVEDKKLKPHKLKQGEYTTPTVPVAYNQMPPGQSGLDIGKKTIALFREKIAQAKMIYWNGPMGVFEVSDFEEGTKAIGLAVAQSNAIKIAAGGDTLNALSKYKLKIDSSTGGGASSDLIVKGTLPSYEALKGNFN